MEALKIANEYGTWFDLKIGDIITMKRNTERVFRIESFKEMEGETWVRIKWFSAMMSPYYAYPMSTLKDDFRLSNTKEKHAYKLITNSIEFICSEESV